MGAEVSLPEYARTGNRCYRKWFGTEQVKRDIEAGRRSGQIKSMNDIPLLPSQIFVLKDLMLILDILDPTTTMRLEDFLEPVNTRERSARSDQHSLLLRAFEDKSSNHPTRSIFRRHQRLLPWIHRENQ